MNYSQIKQLEDVVLSARVVVTDPCYDRSVWCRGELTITPGVYETKLYYSDEGQWGNRVAKLGIYRKGAGETVEEKKTEFSVGVDSGQAGIFCDTVYPQGKTGDYGDKESFYRKVCDLTIGDGYDWQGGTYEGKGIVSSSGYGDGGYDCVVGTDKDGLTTYVEIEFIDVFGDGEEEEEV